jgi:hypothetical protein
MNVYKYFRKFTKYYCVICDKQNAVYFQHESLYSCIVSQLFKSDGLALKREYRGLISTPIHQRDPYVPVGELVFIAPANVGIDEELGSCLKVGNTLRMSIKQVYKYKDQRNQSLPILCQSWDNLDNLLPRRRKLLDSTVSPGGRSILAEVVESRTEDLPFRVKIRLQSSEDFQTIDNLNEHMKEHHKKIYCKLCVEANELFIFDHRLYNAHELDIHNRCGTKASDGKSSINPHPLCSFCNTRFYDHLKLYQHMKQSHYCCQICVSKMGFFFRKQHLLFEHLDKYHLVCRHESCINLFCPPVFSDALALRRHELKHTKKKKQRLRINLITLKEKPKPVRPHPGRDVTFCFPDNCEPVTDDNVLRSQQRENKEKFKDMERRLHRDSVFSNSSITVKREMPDFKSEEADWRRDELYGKLHLHVTNSADYSRLQSAVHLLHTGQAVCSSLFQLFVGILVKYVNMMTFEDLLVDLLRTISDHSLRRELYNAYCLWKSIPRGSRPTYETSVNSIDVTKSKREKKSKKVVCTPKLVSQSKPVPQNDAWERLKVEQGWVSGAKRTPPQTKRLRQPRQWIQNNESLPLRESIVRQQAEQRQTQQSLPRRPEIRVSQKSRRRGRRKSKQTVPQSNNPYEVTSSFGVTPPQSRSSQREGGQYYSNVQHESKTEPDVKAVQLEVSLLGTRFSDCDYKGGHIDFLVAMFNWTVQTLSRREMEARREKRCLNIDLPITSNGDKQKHHTLSISRSVETYDKLLGYQNLEKIKLPQHKASLIESLWLNRETMDDADMWIETTVDDLEDNELYILATYMEDAIVRFLDQKVEKKVSYKSPEVRSKVAIIGRMERSPQENRSTGKRTLRGRGFDLPANIGFDLPQPLENRGFRTQHRETRYQPQQVKHKE